MKNQINICIFIPILQTIHHHRTGIPTQVLYDSYLDGLMYNAYPIKIFTINCNNMSFNFCLLLRDIKAPSAIFSLVIIFRGLYCKLLLSYKIPHIASGSASYSDGKGGVRICLRKKINIFYWK